MGNYDLSYLEFFGKLRDAGISAHVLENRYMLRTGSKRYIVAVRDDYTCQLCGCKATHLEIVPTGEVSGTDGKIMYAHFNIKSDDTLMTNDHIIPRCKNGTSKLANLQLLCSICNSAKGCMDNEEFVNKFLLEGVTHDETQEV